MRAPVPALFFRLEGKVFLVDHLRIKEIICPKKDEPEARAPSAAAPQGQVRICSLRICEPFRG
jgi:hypothetical protein